MLYLAGWIVLLGAATVHGRSDGAPTGACADMTPPSRTDDGHGATSQTDSTFPYEVTFSKTCFKAGDSIDGKWRFSFLNMDNYFITSEQNTPQVKDISILHNKLCEISMG